MMGADDSTEANLQEVSQQPSKTKEPQLLNSPRWGAMTKMVIGLTIVAIIGALLIRFRQIVGPLILSFMLAYLLYPLAKRFSKALKVSWRTSVNLIYLVFIILVGGLIALTSLAVIQQIESLVIFVQRFITDLPTLVANMAGQVYVIGPYTINLGQLFDVQTFTNQVLSTVQPILGRIGGLITSFAGSAVVTFTWGLFVMLTSYFLLSESGRFPGQLVRVDIPGYEEDIRRLGLELGVIWNGFIRGQLLIIALVVISYTILLSILDMHYTFGIAIMAGLARFIPYVGPLVTLVVTGLVAFFQPANYFGLEPIYYVLLVLVACFALDQIYDNIISPRLMGQTLNVHPAAILVAAIVFTNLIGVIGLVLAAPVVATVNLSSRYVLRKMFDLDPWPEPVSQSKPVGMAWSIPLQRASSWIKNLNKK